MPLPRNDLWAPLPYPEELKPDEFIAALELLWAVPGLLAWSALPGDEGLLEFPGEHDDVTAQQRKQNKAGISLFLPRTAQAQTLPLSCPYPVVHLIPCLPCSSKAGSVPQPQRRMGSPGLPSLYHLVSIHVNHTSRRRSDSVLLKKHSNLPPSAPLVFLLGVPGSQT